MSGLKVLDLFSGIGGFSLGLERTGGFETVAFCEIDKKARLVLKKHWPNVPIFEDVTTLTGDQINGKVDVIAGGFPCQDISLAGKGAGLAGARSGLWYEYHRLIKEIRPSWAIIENVAALRNRGLDAVLRSLAEIGYNAEWHCIPASAVGAAHQRDRIWIVAHPRGGECDTRAEKRGVLRALSQDGAVNNNFSGRNPTYTETVADTESRTSWNERQDERSSSGEVNTSGDTGRLGGGTYRPEYGKAVADTNCAGLEGRQDCRNLGSIWPRLQQLLERRPDSIRATWAVEPDVGRVAHGVSGRVDRLKQLGNAVVPQIPELIGRAILASVSEPSR